MFGSSLHHPEDATLSYGTCHSRYLKSQSFRLLITKPSSLNGRLAKWATLFWQYEMQFLPQKAVKGQAVADFLAEHPDLRTTRLYEDLSDEVVEVCMTQTSFEEQVWQQFFDSASRMGLRGNMVARARVILVPP